MNADSNVKKPDIEDDSATGEKLVYNKSDTNAERIIFLLFTAFFLVIVFTQMSISDTFDVNDYANQYVLNVQNATSFLSLHTLTEFEDVYIGLLKQSVDNTWYDTYTINDNEKMLVSFVYFLLAIIIFFYCVKHQTYSKKNFAQRQWQVIFSLNHLVR